MEKLVRIEIRESGAWGSPVCGAYHGHGTPIHELDAPSEMRDSNFVKHGSYDAWRNTYRPLRGYFYFRLNPLTRCMIRRALELFKAKEIPCRLVRHRLSPEDEVVIMHEDQVAIIKATEPVVEAGLAWSPAWENAPAEVPF